MRVLPRLYVLDLVSAPTLQYVYNLSDWSAWVPGVRPPCTSGVLEPAIAWECEGPAKPVLQVALSEKVDLTVEHLPAPPIDASRLECGSDLSSGCRPGPGPRVVGTVGLGTAGHAEI